MTPRALRRHRWVWLLAGVMLAVVLIVVVGMAAIGQARGPVEIRLAELMGRPLPTSGGLWIGCGDPGRVSAVRVTPTGSFNAYPGRSVLTSSAPDAQALYRSACRVVAANKKLRGSIACPNDNGLHFDGEFLGRSGPVATFDAAVTGCAQLSLRVDHGVTVSSADFGSAAPVYDEFRATLERVLGRTDPLPGQPGFPGP